MVYFGLYCPTLMSVLILRTGWGISTQTFGKRVSRQIIWWHPVSDADQNWQLGFVLICSVLTALCVGTWTDITMWSRLLKCAWWPAGRMETTPQTLGGGRFYPSERIRRSKTPPQYHPTHPSPRSNTTPTFPLPPPILLLFSPITRKNPPAAATTLNPHI